MRYVLIFIFLLTTNPALSMAQNREVQSDGWRGLVLDVSTPEDAVRVLGKPSKDEDKVSVRVWGVDNWLNGEERRKIFRTLSYKSGEVKGVEFVELAFLDGRLVVITLRELPAPDRREAGWIDPDDLGKLFSAPLSRGSVSQVRNCRRFRSFNPPPRQNSASMTAIMTC